MSRPNRSTFSVERTPKLSTRRLPVLSPHIWFEVLTDLRELCVAPNGRRQPPWVSKCCRNSPPAFLHGRYFHVGGEWGYGVRNPGEPHQVLIKRAVPSYKMVQQFARSIDQHTRKWTRSIPERPQFGRRTPHWARTGCSLK